MDPDWIVGSIDMTIDEDVGAILVKTDGRDGTLRVTGHGLPRGFEDIETGLDTKELVLVVMKSDQQRTVFGHPSMRMFRRS